MWQGFIEVVYSEGHANSGTVNCGIKSTELSLKQINMRLKNTVRNALNRLTLAVCFFPHHIRFIRLTADPSNETVI
jgi:hypothetical protein